MTALDDRLAGYLAVRRALGYKLARTEKLLAQFIAWLQARGEQAITTDLALAWATLPPATGSNWHAQRLSVVRAFAAHLHALDPAHEIVPQELLPQRPNRAVPYLYTDGEVLALIDAASVIPTPHRAATMRALIGLLAVTGMRIGEAIGLDRGDIDHARDTLTVRESKFGKSRELAVDPSTLTKPELQALLDAPDQSTWIGRRDHALILLAAQTGLLVSELLGLSFGDIRLGTGAHVNCLGKGRKQRITPLTTQTVDVIRAWIRERAGQPDEPLFTTSTGRKLSRDAVEHYLAKHAATAATACPSLTTKTVTPHVLRHTAAMRLLHADVDTTVIALWLGHEQIQTTQIYLHADLAIKQKALDRTTQPNAKPGRYQPTDLTLAFLDAL
jgi:integrase